METTLDCLPVLHYEHWTLYMQRRRIAPWLSMYHSLWSTQSGKIDGSAKVTPVLLE